MKNLLSLFVVIILWAGNSWASVNEYTFTSSMGNYTTYSGGVVLGNINNNEQVFNNNPAGATPPVTNVGFPIGFIFTYNGIDYDKFAVNTNGWILLGTGVFTIGATTGNATPISTSATVGFVSVISALGLDLQGQSGSELSYLYDGVAPNRVLIIQWKGYRYISETGDNFNFQIRLYETTNEVEIAYGSFVKVPPLRTVQVGLRGDNNSDFHNRTTPGDWLSTTQGVINTNTCPLTPVYYPFNGLIYKFAASLDFGDAPAPYPTLLLNNGARHTSTGLKLGAQIDVEVNGIPQAAALGDDNNNLDDEDGVWWGCNFTPGQANTVQVTASGAGLLNAWFDFNIDGDWADPGEHVFTNTALVAGINYLSVTVPANSVIGLTFARFRFSTQSNLTYTGPAGNGEVEDYQVSIDAVVPMDYGDAPNANYQTLAASNGARHAQPGGIFLGAARDFELDGQPNAFAAGDIPDEDGVIFTTPFIPGSPAMLSVTASLGNGVLQGWIDFNQDGDWLDAGEQIFTNTLLALGPQVLNFNVPAGAIQGKTYARFRYSTMPNLMPFGCAPNGEVEDYMVYIGENDLGDAPDPTYPTLLASNGAIHKITGLFMGVLIDAESNGQPDPTASGDDNSPAGFDDEDGVWWPCSLTAGHRSTYKVTTNGPGTLNAWIDYNGDGDWADPGEQVFSNVLLQAGTADLFATTPLNATIGTTFMRFRFSSLVNLSFTGYAPDGEVEDYSIIIQAADVMEFGDAPDSYSTLATSNGARHVHDPIFNPVFLGNAIDWEMSGQPTVNADGDDLNPAGAIDDEDGIVFTTPWNPGLPATILVNASINGAAFQGWVDFNADGDWGDPGEQIFTNTILTAGPQPLMFNIPATAVVGNTYARFRFSTMGNLSYYGCAPNGEVEDYRAAIELPQPDLDYGDAPDPTYPTLLASNGARHAMSALKLGNSIDIEPNALPNATATGDDTNNLDDEDGVWWPCNFIPGHTSTVQVTASGAGYLSAWFDFNGDGDWADSGEQVFTNVALPAGTRDLFVAVPANAAIGATYARFRLSSQLLLSYTGSATDGEVEDYLITVQASQDMDYGDAPDPAYPTLAASNGARHMRDPVSNPVFLGNLIDWEINGLPNALAKGDDLNNLADEDGVVFNTPLAPGAPAVITVTASIAGCAFQGWIDFNNDGDWMDAGEQIFINKVLAAGPQPLVFNVPAGSPLGNTYARFRFSTMANLKPYGCAPNGEAEDYMVYIGQLDFGDAPDPTYPTLLNVDGARHQLDGITYLGVQTDAEVNGQPSATAIGDDMTGLDDEDGVTFLWPLASGNPCKVKVNASVATGLLSTWIDYNRNGSWADPGEQVFADLNLVAGDNYLTFIAPVGINPGPTFARFRFSHQPGLTCSGYAYDGEVEDYAVDISQYGDIKWQQSYDTRLPGLHSSETAIIADDWICNGGLVTDLHWWGNYETDNTGAEERGQGIHHFLITIYSNAQCLPGQAIQTYTIPFTSISEVNTGDMNSEMGFIYYYEVQLPQPFYQLQGSIYWVSIQAISNNPVPPNNAVWRWQEANRWFQSINCGAASSTPTAPWMTIFWNWPPPGQFSDMAFVITSQVISYDYGDAPDPTYPTLLVNNGARHTNTGLRMGNSIDIEPNGIPNASATGDDGNNLDDEDGVWWPCNFVPGQTNSVQVTTTGPGFLNAWFDFNMDGDWADPGEQVFTNTAVVAGVNYLAVTVPSNIAVGQTFARFRFSTQLNLSYTGLASDGEVEDYAILIEPASLMDYGDAPDPTYPTMAASNGARHGSTTGTAIFLGNLVDWEMDGQPGPGANGDDLNPPIGITDEDGIVFNTPLIPGLPALVTVTASINGAALQGWIDFNSNGSWMDAGEQIFTNTILLAGPQQLNFTVPPNALIGHTYARFRYSTMGNLMPFGCAPNGEVEDYRFYIGQPDEFDWGDLPDPLYPTLAASNGPSHKVGPLFLGNLIDSENNGQPHLSALGDDLNNLPDENGVAFTSNIIPGSVVNVTVTASQAGGLLQGWIDLNADGDFNDAGEQIFTNTAVLAGPNALSFTVNPAAQCGATFARFRLSTFQNLGYTGVAPDGEVEDYKVFIVIPGEGKMHWNQLPDMDPTGMDVDLTWVPTADDFLCTESGPINRIRIWVSFAGDSLPPVLNDDTVRLQIFSDIPAGVQNPWSMPGNLLWSKTYLAGQYTATIVSTNSPEWWYDPATQIWWPNDHQIVARFDFDLTNQPFVQTMNQVYWLEAKYLYNIPPNLNNTLGWKTAKYALRFNDDAVWWNQNNPNFPFGWVPHVYPGQPIPHPYAGQSFDMSFVINPPDELDFGDAPDTTYPTLLAHNGARHLIANSTFLGALVDGESDGQPTLLANGDDLANSDDEDGVIFMWPLASGMPCKLKVNASVGDGLFNCWIDFNGNGSWAELNEHVFADINLLAGANYLTFITPQTAVPGPTFARFRFSHQPALSFVGPAFDGEVEDYAVNLIEYSDRKWQQFPDTLLPGLHVNEMNMLADDWRCNGGVVTDLHWWGNYEVLGGIEQRGMGINHFLVNIYTDANCLPGNVVKTYVVPFTAGIEVYTGTKNNEGSRIYKYSFLLPEPFIQVKNSKYWLSIQAMSNNPVNPPSWRWQEANRWLFPILCGAASNSGPGWQTIMWPFPPLIKYTDLAFEITSWVLDTLSLQNIDVTSGQDICYDANLVIFVAGNGTTFTVQPGGRATMIAGQKIFYQPGTKVFPGGYMHGYITTTGAFCNSLKSAVAATDLVVPEIQGLPEAVIPGTKLNVYPNPTTGNFILELTDPTETAPARVEIYGLMGKKVFNAEFPPQSRYELSLSTQPPGVYVLRVITGREVWAVKVIKR